ncbi:lantibiotic dehydratase [Streptomyces phaeochromogenes]|nr:lantibiotic dehydratase [Streptomyces phaeochromogenes]
MAACVTWLRAVWANQDVAEALQHSSSVLAAQLQTVCQAERPPLRDVRRAAQSVARYLLRAQHRATPFGLFAGVTTAEFGPQESSGWGAGHVAVGRAGAEWLAAVIDRLESCPALLERLPVVVNNTVSSRGDRLIVPFQPDVQDDRTRAVETSLALTAPVRAVLAVARAPIQVGMLVGKLRAEFPEAGAERARHLLAELIRRRVLITSLHAPSTETDALGYLLGQLDVIDAGTLAPVAETVRELRAVRAGLEECATRGGRDSVAARMRALVPGLRRHPVALDLHLDAQIVLPDEVAREIERAALILTRVSTRPYGTAAWGEYHQRFYERYGIGTMVPLQEVVSDSGTGYPDGYPGSPADTRRPRLSARDDVLVRLAQAAALDGRDEALLTDELVATLDVGPEEPRLPPHLEVGVRVHAASLGELQRGRFRLEVVSVSRGVGVSTGRFLTELSRAQCAQVTVFDWGAAAAMPFLPRLRYGRTVLAPARWRLEAFELPGRARPRVKWDAALTDWRTRRRLPHRVHLVEDDRRLFLDLDEAGHRTLLRQHLDRTDLAVLVEAPEPEAYGWCDGRAHEVVVPLKATRPSTWPPLPAPTQARILCPAQIQTPASSPVLLATLYGDARRQDALLSRHLPVLLEQLGNPPWWFIRFRDPDQHLRVRIALSAPEAFAETAHAVSSWADELRDLGLLADLRYATSYREMGRWGSGAAWEAAEEVFRADSRAVLTQLAQPQHPGPRTLVAAHTVAVASAFLGSTEVAMRWLIDHIPPTAPVPVPRPQFTEAVRLADPSDEWAALRRVPGGDAIVSGWADRDTALAGYRQHLPGPDTQGIAIDDVLVSLLHVHFVRHIAVNFPEEEVCLYLARATALAWTARTTGRTS